MTSKIFKNNINYITFASIFIIILRFILLDFIPLFDKTESRYAEIARIMAETNEWVVLQIDYGKPFWAKPPLSSWLSAISFNIFGVNEIAARLPSFLLCLLIIVIVGNLVKKQKTSFYIPAFILLTTPEFLLHTGVVSTDTALCFSVVLIMLSFWQAMNNERSLWNYMFFIGIGLGLITKGPLVLVLTIPPLFIWILIHKIKIKELLTKLPWVLGILISLIIAVPWYVLAEHRSPGFLDYFIIGEHFNRFFVPKWKGDLYGGPKSQALGMIWVFLLLFAFPWIQLVFIKLWKERTTIFKNKWISFLVLWLLWTPFFFTFSKNILHTYTLPVMVPIALLVAHWWTGFKNKKTLLILGSIFPGLVTILVVGSLFVKNPDFYFNSDKYLIENQNIFSNNQDTPLFYWRQMNYSGEFYSKGKAQKFSRNGSVDSLLNAHKDLYLVISNKWIHKIPKQHLDRMKAIDSNYKTTIYVKER